MLVSIPKYGYIYHSSSKSFYLLLGVICQFINVLFYAITPLYGINASSHIVDLAQFRYLAKPHIRTSRSFISTLVKDVIVNLSFIIIVAMVQSMLSGLAPTQSIVNGRSTSHWM